MTGLSERARAEAALITVTLIWGATFTLVKQALGDVSTVAFLAIRFTIATAAVTLFSRRALQTAETPFGPPPRRRRQTASARRFRGTERGRVAHGA